MKKLAIIVGLIMFCGGAYSKEMKTKGGVSDGYQVQDLGGGVN